MTTAHDPLCLAGEYDDCQCDCDLIARVREDERDCDAHGDTIRYRCTHYQQGRKDGYAAALRDAAESVKAAAVRKDTSHDMRAVAVAAIEALNKHSNI